MARLKDHGLNLTRRGVRGGEIGRVRAVLPILIFLSLGLMLLSRLNHSTLSDARWRIAEWMSPVMQAAVVPLEPIRHFGRQLAAQLDMTGELQRLKSENQKLNSWEWRARELERKLADLESLSKVVEDPKIEFVTSRVIADSSGAFVRVTSVGVIVVRTSAPPRETTNSSGSPARSSTMSTRSSKVTMSSPSIERTRSPGSSFPSAGRSGKTTPITGGGSSLSPRATTK